MRNKTQVVEINETLVPKIIHEKRGEVRQVLIDQLDLLMIPRAMKMYNNNQTRVAEVLGINRATLKRRLVDLKLVGEKF